MNRWVALNGLWRPWEGFVSYCRGFFFTSFIYYYVSVGHSCPVYSSGGQEFSSLLSSLQCRRFLRACEAGISVNRSCHVGFVKFLGIWGKGARRGLLLFPAGSFFFQPNTPPPPPPPLVALCTLPNLPPLLKSKMTAIMFAQKNTARWSEVCLINNLLLS